MKLFKGSATVASRRSPESLYHAGLASFGEEATYDHADAEGYIKLFGLPARVAAERDSRRGGTVEPSEGTIKQAEVAESKDDGTETSETVPDSPESGALKTPVG